MPHSRLEDLILAAFKRAEAEGRRDAAEHLMQALEVLCPGSDDAAPRASAPTEAYGHSAREGPSAARGGADGPGGRGAARDGGDGRAATRTSARPARRRR